MKYFLLDCPEYCLLVGVFYKYFTFHTLKVFLHEQMSINFSQWTGGAATRKEGFEVIGQGMPH